MLLAAPTENMGTRLGDKAAVGILAKAGFDAIDYSMFQMTDPGFHLNGPGRIVYAKELRATADSLGIRFIQAHSPFPVFRAADPAYTRHMFDATVKALEIAGLLGVKTMIVHPFALPDLAAQKAANLDFYRRLLPYCKEYAVKIALENMWAWDKAADHAVPNVCSTGESFAEYMDAIHEIDSDWFTACLDLGHCGMVGETAAGMIRALGKNRLTALHVHDNDNHLDTHTIPYLGKMDWPAITEALREIEYTGDFTFEADSFLAQFPDELLEAGSVFMEKIGRKLIADMELT